MARKEKIELLFIGSLLIGLSIWLGIPAVKEWMFLASQNSSEPITLEHWSKAIVKSILPVVLICIGIFILMDGEKYIDNPPQKD